MKQLGKRALLAIAGAALIAQSTNAQTTVQYNDGDLFLGFRATGGAGAPSDYLIDIGQPSQFDHSFTLSLGNIGQDLNDIYGPSWFSRTDLLYAVVGGSVIDNTVYTSNPSATAWHRQFAQGDISSLTDSLGSFYGGNTSTANSNLAIIQLTASQNSYASFQPGGSNSIGISFQTWNPTNEGTPGVALYLNKLVEGSSGLGSVLGRFSVASTGSTNASVNFNLVPEPSTYAMLGLGTVLFVAGVRRRQKTAKSLVTGLLVLSFASIANAQTYVRITGANALRVSLNNAIGHLLDPGYTYAYQASSLSGANVAIFTGAISGNPVVIKTNLIGSEGGIGLVSHQDSLGFLPDTTPQSVGGTVVNSAAPLSDSSIPDVTLTDSFQSSSYFNGTFQGKTYPTLASQVVGVVGLKFVAGKGTAGVTNITSQLARALYANGKLPLALFTGNSGDETKFVYAVGRDLDAGVRLTAFAETGVGAVATVKQYEPLTNVSGSNVLVTTASSTITNLVPWPAGSVNGTTYSTFNGGYNKGTQLAGALASSSTNVVIGTGTTGGTAVNLVGYLSDTDADTVAVPGGAVELTYNGVPYSVSNIQEGKYTLWAFVHLDYQPGYSGFGKTVADLLANQLITVDAPILLSTLRVTRNTDGSTVKNNY